MNRTEVLPEVLQSALKTKGHYAAYLHTGFKVYFTGAKLSSPGWVLLENPQRLNRDAVPVSDAVNRRGLEVRLSEIAALTSVGEGATAHAMVQAQ